MTELEKIFDDLTDISERLYQLKYYDIDKEIMSILDYIADLLEEQND